MQKKPGVRLPALVPNRQGFLAARAVGVREIAVFTAASETFNKKNINATKVLACFTRCRRPPRAGPVQPICSGSRADPLNGYRDSSVATFRSIEVIRYRVRLLTPQDIGAPSRR